MSNQPTPESETNPVGGRPLADAAVAGSEPAFLANAAWRASCSQWVGEPPAPEEAWEAAPEWREFKKRLAAVASRAPSPEALQAARGAGAHLLGGSPAQQPEAAPPSPSAAAKP